MQDHRTYIVLISFDVLVEGASSLKVKRGVINRIKDRIRSRFNASVAEIGYLDKWQRAAMGVTMISNEKRHLTPIRRRFFIWGLKGIHYGERSFLPG